MAFEVFKHRNIPNRGVAVTITVRGQLLLSTAAHRELGETRHVTLMFDRDTRTIGVQPCDDSGDGFRVTTARSVNATAFVRPTRSTNRSFSPARWDRRHGRADLNRPARPTPGWPRA